MAEQRTRAFFVPSTLHTVLDVPDRVFVESGQYLALVNKPGELVVADLTSPRLQIKAGVTQKAAHVVRQMGTISTFTPEPSDYWEATIEGRSHVAKLSAGLAPGGAAWTSVARIDRIRVNVVRHGRPLAITFHPSATPSSAAERCLELLRLAIPLAKRCREAQQALLVLLQGQHIELVSTGVQLPTRRVGSPDAPTRLPAQGGVFAVWNRPKAARTFIVESSAATFSSGALRRGRREPTSTARILDACAVLEEALPREPTSPGLYRLGSAESPTRVRVAEIVVERLRGQWSIRRADPGHGEETAERFMLTDGKSLIAIEFGRRMTVDEVVTLLAKIGAQATHLTIFAQSADTPVTVQWPGLRAAVDSTLRRAGSDDADDEHAAPSALEVDHAVMLLAAASNPSDDRGGGPAILPRRLLEAVAGRSGGLELIASVHVRRLQQETPAGERAERMAEFADALTAYLAAVSMSRANTSMETRQFVVQAVCDWLQTSSRERDSVSPDVFLGVARHDWQRLVGRAPWLEWFCATDPPRAHRAHVSVEGLAAALALLRPKQDARPHPSIRGRRVFPSRWWNLFVADDAPELDSRLLLELATCLETALLDPANAARVVQGLPLSTSVRDKLQSWLDEMSFGRTRSEALLAIHVAGPHSPVLVLNGDEAGPLSLAVDGHEIRLPPRALESNGAVDYELQAYVAATADLRVADERIELIVPDPGVAHGVGFTDYAIGEWFRGRDEEMAMLSYALLRHDRRPASLIVGPRRAGKSTLAWHLGDDPRAGGRVLIDLGGAPVSVSDFGAWNRAMVRQLEREVRRHLGVRDALGVDLVDALITLDDLVGARAPVVVVLDEIDVLLGEGEGDGLARRTAGRLGATAFRNLAVVGTAQRFHHSTHEFKAWQHIECRADLRWADGVTYFLEPLSRNTAAPRVECLERSAASVRSFSEIVVPRAGLRPYFWGRLRSRMEGYARGIADAPRLIGAEQLTTFLDDIVRGDPHLASIFDRGKNLSRGDFQRQDLFTPQERSILAAFSTVPRGQNSIALQTALARGGEDALASLLDRAFLKVVPGERIGVAVPLYLEFLRSRTRELLEALDRDGGETLEGDLIVGGARRFAVPAGALDDEVLNEVRARIDKALGAKGYVSIGTLGHRLRSLVPGPGWAGFETFSEWLSATIPDLTFTRHPFSEGTVWRDVEMSRQPITAQDPSADITDEVRAAVAACFDNRDHLPISNIGNMIATQFPGIRVSGKLSRWLARNFPEYIITDYPYAEGTIWAEGADRATVTTPNGESADVIRAALLSVFGSRTHMSAAALRVALERDFPAIQISGKFTQWLDRFAPSFPVTTHPFATGTVWRDEEALAEEDEAGVVNSEETRAKVRTLVAEAMGDADCISGGALGKHLRSSLPSWGERSMTEFLADFCPDLVSSAFPYVPVTFWRNSEARRAANLRASNGSSEEDPAAAVTSASMLQEFDEALRRYVVVGIELAGAVRTSQFSNLYVGRSRLEGEGESQSASDWVTMHAPELTLGAQHIKRREHRDSRSATGNEVMLSPPVLAAAVQIAENLVRSSPHTTPIADVGAALRDAGINIRRTEEGSPFAEVLVALESTTDVEVVRGLNGYLWIPAQHRRPG